MNTLLLRRLQRRPAGDYFTRRKEFLQGLERENYMQRFAPLLDGGRVRCAQALELCRGELEQLCPQAPREGWLLCAFDYARQQLFPEPGRPFCCRYCRCCLTRSGSCSPLTPCGILLF